MIAAKCRWSPAAWIAGDGAHLVRDMATETVRAAGAVGTEVLRAASGALVELVDGLRGVVRSHVGGEEPHHAAKS